MSTPRALSISGEAWRVLTNHNRYTNRNHLFGLADNLHGKCVTLTNWALVHIAQSAVRIVEAKFTFMGTSNYIWAKYLPPRKKYIKQFAWLSLGVATSWVQFKKKTCSAIAIVAF